VSILRRQFLKNAALIGGAAGFAPGVVEAAVGSRGPEEGPIRDYGGGQDSPGRELRILILGGTGFIGPHQVRYALSRGHTLTLFNRGRTAPELFPDLEQLRGDRDTGDLGALEGNREWDVVVDNSAMTPQWVEDSAGLLRERVGQYIFISTQSVYASRGEIDIDETSPVGMPGTPKEEWRGYGPLKVLCEEEVQAAFGAGATIVRPGLIVGPGDRSDRFTYWPVRIHRGGAIVAPGTPQDPVQNIDVRDLCEWLVHLAEGNVTGVFNAIGPASRLSMAEMLYGIRAVTSTPSSFIWVETPLLRELGIRPWSDLPAWMPPEGATAGFARMSNARAVAAGLNFRPLATTARDTLDWYLTERMDVSPELRAGLTPEREAFVLSAWRARHGGTNEN
jgi:2'-hydroxyisoflavone reductase